MYFLAIVYAAKLFYALRNSIKNSDGMFHVHYKPLRIFACKTKYIFLPSCETKTQLCKSDGNSSIPQITVVLAVLFGR